MASSRFWKAALDGSHIARLRAQGLSWLKIADKLGVGEGTVSAGCFNFSQKPPQLRPPQRAGLTSAGTTAAARGDDFRTDQ